MAGENPLARRSKRKNYGQESPDCKIKEDPKV